MGFVMAKHGARTMLLKRACAMKNIDGKLTAQAVITGRVVDEDGEPLANVRVDALRSAYQNGRITYISNAGVSSNDKGEYRIFGVAPGRYYISAVYSEPNHFGPAEIRGDTDGDYAPIYYLSTPLLTDATAVQAVAGREIVGIDVRLTRQKLPHVFGKVIGLPKGVGAQVFLMDRGSGAFRRDGMKNVMVDERGYFVFRGITPGRYMLTALAITGGDRKIASAVIQVGSENLESVQLIFGPPTVITGSLRIEHSADLSSLKGRRLNFVPMGGGVVLISPTVALNTDGSFEVRNLRPDSYHVVFQPELHPYYVKSIRLGSVESTGPIVDLTDSLPSEITVTLGNRAAQIQGMVNDEDKPAVEATVVLVPDDRDKTYLYKTASADHAGKFTLNIIPPGRYKLFAFENAEVESWQDPEFLKVYEERGTSVELTEAANETKDLKLLRSPAISDLKALHP
jgi:protocatechuate 3,4-dioxygenase beta subunit